MVAGCYTDARGAAIKQALFGADYGLRRRNRKELRMESGADGETWDKLPPSLGFGDE